MTHDAVVFSDGGCSPNPGPGAWAAIVRYGLRGEVELSGFEEQTTNNRMEMTACLAGLRHLAEVRMETSPGRYTVPRRVLLVSDSKLLLTGISEWLDKWKTRGWWRQGESWGATGGIANRDLWEEIDEHRRRFRIETRWVRGHSGHAENERCDEMCRELIRSRGAA